MARAMMQSDVSSLEEWVRRKAANLNHKCQVLNLQRRPIVMTGEQGCCKGQEAACEPSLCPSRKGQQHLGIQTVGQGKLLAPIIQSSDDT